MRSSAKVALATLTFAVAAFSTAQKIQVQVDGQPVYFAGTQPQYINGRVLVPLRGVFEQMGANVFWNQSNQMVTATKDNTEVHLTIGQRSAMVNGSTMMLDVPAMVVNGSTMVPIRFVSEALGADVGWLAAQNLVTVNTGNIGSVIVTPPQTLRRIVLRENYVIPVTLDNSISSANNVRGDTFTATINTGRYDGYNDIPAGTKIEGHVAAVRSRGSGQPAILDLRFDRIRFPSGRSARIDGDLTSLDDQYVLEDSNGMLVARNNNRGPDQRMVYAGYGAGAGLLVGVLTRRPLEGAILGGALGYILGQVQKDQRQTKDVTLASGTQMGVRLNQALTASW